jgi:hypothetical protein
VLPSPIVPLFLLLLCLPVVWLYVELAALPPRMPYSVDVVTVSSVEPTA